MDYRPCLPAIHEHARETYPHECCGFVRADGTVHRAVNIQNTLHADDPTRYPRDGLTGYTMSSADVLALAKSFRSANPAIAIYHSHPDVGAYFSNEDAARALYAGQPLHPVDHLVVDVRGSVVRETKRFAWRPPKFICVETLTMAEQHD